MKASTAQTFVLLRRVCGWKEALSTGNVAEELHASRGLCGARTAGGLAVCRWLSVVRGDLPGAGAEAAPWGGGEGGGGAVPAVNP